MEVYPTTSPSCRVDDILRHYEYDASMVQRVSYPKLDLPLSISPPDPAWPSHFKALEAIIAGALGPTALSIAHIGSTSVPNLPAKAIIDIDLTIADPRIESEYVPSLEAAGFQLLHREPHWHEHRFFLATVPYHCNLHVFKPGAAELVRHQIMKEWLTTCEADRKLCAQTKIEAVNISASLGESVQEYNMRKESVIRGILENAFRAKGYLSSELPQSKDLVA